MKKLFYSMMCLLCSVLVFTACGDDDDDPVIDEVWKTENEQALADIAANSEYTKYQAKSSTDANKVIYKKVLKAGNGKKIFYNSRVNVYYKGWYIDGVSFDQRLIEDGIPAMVAVSSAVANATSIIEGYATVIEGWTTALQFMEEGEKAEIWIPQELAYGPEGTKNSNTGEVIIPGYSTLKFEIEVVKAYTYGVDF